MVAREEGIRCGNAMPCGELYEIVEIVFSNIDDVDFRGEVTNF